MKLRTVLNHVMSEEVRVRPGRPILSGITGQPDFSAAFLIVAPRHQGKFARCIRFLAAPHRAVAGFDGSRATVIGTGGQDELVVTLIETAHQIVFDREAPRIMINSPARWPALFKKLAK
jgi:hypothetical protein